MSAEDKEELLASIGVGSVVDVYWPNEKRSYKGTIKRKNPDQRHVYYIVYEDGDEGDFDLSDWEFKIVDVGGMQHQRRKLKGEGAIPIIVRRIFAPKREVTLFVPKKATVGKLKKMIEENGALTNDLCRTDIRHLVRKRKVLDDDATIQELNLRDYDVVVTIHGHDTDPGELQAGPQHMYI